MLIVAHPQKAPDPLTGLELTLRWAQAVGPAVAALIVLAGVALTIWQKNRTDARTLWWTRVEWAAERAADSDAGKKAIGAAALNALAAGKVKNKADRELIGAIVNVELADVAEQLDPTDSTETVVFELDEGDA